MNAFGSTLSLVRLVLRRDRVRLPVWVLGLVGITYFSGAAVAGTYDTPREVASYAANIGSSPASIAMAGPPVGLDAIDGILVFETALVALVGVALMVIFTVVRHTRGEEELGRTELLVSTVVGRHAGVAAAVLVAVGAAVVVALGVSASMLSVGMHAPAAWLYGASVVAMGLVFAAVAAVAAQLMSHGRSAIGLSLAVLGVAFVVRAVGDVRDNGWSWASPMGWSQQVHLTVDNRWWPLLPSMGLSVLLLAATVLLATRRDLGAGIVPARPGSPTASRLLSSSLGLAWRLQRGSVIGWCVGVFAMGVAFGSLTQELENMVADNPTLAEYFERSGGSITDGFFATTLLLLGIGASGFAVASALRVRGEESVGRLEAVLAGSVSRWRALGESLVVTVLGATLVVAVGALGVGLAYAQVTDRFDEAVQLVGYGLVHLPAVLVLVGVAVALTGWLPRMTVLAWAGVALAFLVGWLGGILDFPGWVRALSPFEHVPAVPVEAVSLGSIVGLTLLAALLVAAGMVGFRRRDLTV